MRAGERVGVCRQVVTQTGRTGVFGEELDADKQAQTRLPSLLPNLIWSSVWTPPESAQRPLSVEESDPVRNDKQQRVGKHKHVLSFAVGQETQGLGQRKLGEICTTTFRNVTK